MRDKVSNEQLIEKLSCYARWDCMTNEQLVDNHICMIAANRIRELREKLMIYENAFSEIRRAYFGDRYE